VSAVSSRTRSAAPQEACRARQFSALRGGLCVCKEACGNHLLVSEAARDPQSVAQGSRRFFCVLLGESDEGYAQERVGFVFDVRQLATEFRRPLKVQPGCVVVAFFERDVPQVVVREGKGERVTAAQCHLGGLVVERLSAFEVALQLNCQGEREERSRDHGTVSAGAAELEALFAPSACRRRASSRRQCSSRSTRTARASSRRGMLAKRSDLAVLGHFLWCWSTCGGDGPVVAA
jgi:hypothetical protein